MTNTVEYHDRHEVLKQRQKELDAISPTYCLAKWLQSTTTLYNGYTHSCHHPTAHKINIEDIKNNPQGLHNTPIKIAARHDMINGIQTKECDYCWNIENLPGEHTSDRHYKSAWDNVKWAQREEVVASGTGANIAPSYLEVAFESVCNFKCVYCSPDVSSRWMEEIQTHGGFLMPNGEMMHDLDWLKRIGKYPIHHKEQNPYIDAFWQWWPELYQSLHTFRITGGEPLLSDNTWKILDYIIENPRKDFNLGINTNMGVPHKLIEKLCHKLNQLNGKIASITIFTSTESVGEQAEYARFGMDWKLFNDNIQYFLYNTPPKIRMQIMTTVNILSAPKYDWFIDWVHELRLAFGGRPNMRRIGYGTAYLRWPKHLSITLLDEEQKRRFTLAMERIIKIHHEDKSEDANDHMILEEADQIRRLVDFMNSVHQDPVQLDAFAGYIDELDSRRGTNFLETFPTLAQVYNQGHAYREQRLGTIIPTINVE